MARNSCSGVRYVWLLRAVNTCGYMAVSVASILSSAPLSVKSYISSVAPNVKISSISEGSKYIKQVLIKRKRIVELVATLVESYYLKILS